MLPTFQFMVNGSSIYRKYRSHTAHFEREFMDELWSDGDGESAYVSTRAAQVLAKAKHTANPHEALTPPTSKSEGSPFGCINIRCKESPSFLLLRQRFSHVLESMAMNCAPTTCLQATTFSRIELRKSWYCNISCSIFSSKGILVMPKQHFVDSDIFRRMSLRLFSGLVFSSVIGLIAYRRKSLDKSGMLGSIVSGTSIVGTGGWSWGLSLVYFFVSSSLLSSFRASDKVTVASDKFSKGSRRDLSQVAANGGLATFFALCFGFSRTATTRRRAKSGFIGALATATADTWATELGTLSVSSPRLITNGKPVAPGTSGGITPLGMTASAVGATSPGFLFWAIEGFRTSLVRTPLLALLSGMAGSSIDSVLGAKLQVMYTCPTCKTETEQHIHHCGTHTEYLRGLPWMNNDVVNFLATAVGSVVAIVLDIFFA